MSDPGKTAPLGSLLGGLDARAFMRRYWQRRALLIRGAIPRFDGVLADRDLFRLAARDDVESRVVLNENGRWSVDHGPFRAAQIKALPSRNWTLLVQGVNLHVPAADALLRRFSFIPYARLDDLMVSYAAPGGGVGPHFDSYDVFLLQGRGRRRWRVSRQPDLTLRPSLPLKILARFQPEFDHTLVAGDMLYLPPDYAHDGVALDTCTTYSIGFRAASAQQLSSAFLDWVHDHIAVTGQYRDPGRTPTSSPARIDASIRQRYASLLRGVRWTPRDVSRFLGCYLTEPGAQVFFEPPAPPLTQAQFVAQTRQHGMRLDARTLLLYDSAGMFINGESIPWSGAVAEANIVRQPNKGWTAAARIPRFAVTRLANERQLSANDVAKTREDLSLLYHWYCDGFLHVA